MPFSESCSCCKTARIWWILGNPSAQYLAQANVHLIQGNVHLIQSNVHLTQGTVHLTQGNAHSTQAMHLTQKQCALDTRQCAHDSRQCALDPRHCALDTTFFLQARLFVSGPAVSDGHENTRVKRAQSTPTARKEASKQNKERTRTRSKVQGETDCTVHSVPPMCT